MKKIGVAIICLMLIMCSCTKNPYLDEVKYSDCRQVIEFYFKALEQHNLNMVNAVLYTPLESLYWELEAIETIELKEIDYSQELSKKYEITGHYKTEVYVVDFYVHYRRDYEMFSENGNHTYYFIMTKDDRLHPWKIYGFNSLEQ